MPCVEGEEALGTKFRNLRSTHDEHLTKVTFLTMTVILYVCVCGLSSLYFIRLCRKHVSYLPRV